MSNFNNIEYQKEYYKNNKNDLLNRLKQKTICETCGGSYSYVGKNRHNLSNKHIRSLNKNDNINYDSELIEKVKQFITEELNKKKE